MALVGLSCAPVGPDFVRPDAEAPASWSQPIDQGLAAAAGDLVAWWRIFDDPVLNGLVEAALRSNNGLEIAGLRVLEARAQLGIASGARYPQTQIAFGDANWISPPENTGSTSSFEQYNLGATAAWEIDFWGRFRRGIESADAAYLASIAAYQQAQVLLTAAVVDVYTAVRVTEEQLRIAHENMSI